MKTIKSISFLAIAITLAVGCAQRGDDTGTDAGSGSGSGGKQIDPPAESASWPCRSGVDAEGDSYLEFRPGYLNNGASSGTSPAAM